MVATCEFRSPLPFPSPRPLCHTSAVHNQISADADRPSARTKSRRIPVRAVLKVIACIAVFGYIVNLLRLLASGVEVRHLAVCCAWSYVT